MPAPKLVDPSGRALIAEPRLIVLKADQEDMQKVIQSGILQQLAKMMGCNTVAIPLNTELHTGLQAVSELEKQHEILHHILGESTLDLSKAELDTIFHGIQLMVEKFKPISSSPIFAVQKRVKDAQEKLK
jgi:hypothetical protein